MPIITEERFKDITSRFPKLDPILIIGDIGIDKYTYGEVTRISPEAPVPVVEVKREWLKLGLAANISHNLKTLGIDSTLCGIIGEDKNAALFENLLEENYLKTWGIVRSADRPTTLKERVTTPTQQICRVDYESNEDIDEALSKKFFTRTLDLSDGHSGVIIQDYGKGSLTESLLRDYITYFKNKNMQVAVDPSRTTKPHLYRGVDILKPNLLEATILLDELGYREKDIEKMAMILSEELEISKLVITLGGKGMALLENSGQSSS
ncbi:MAG: bifunctional heptose 7-phosphate kinase/heptose 1-phosphate adenyltransferase, partial [Bacteriovoracaceae bacterium]